MIKEIDEKDIAEAVGLANGVFAEFVAGDYSEEGKKTFTDYLKVKLAEVTADIASGHKKMWGYFNNNGTIVGMIAVRQISHISLFFVRRAHQGKGIGRLLFDCAVRFAGQSGHDKMTVNSSLYAVPIYESLGFKKTDDRQESNGIIYVPMQMTL